MLEKVLERHSQRMELMRAMMDRLDVDSVAAARDRRGSALVTAVRTCKRCPHATECALWVNNLLTEGERPSFCANADFFLAHRATRLWN